MAGAKTLDLGLCQVLAVSVEKLTTSGQHNLDESLMKDVKRICKKSDEYVKLCFHQCIAQLEKDHSEIRLSSFLILAELFNRSHCFRELLLQDFQNFMELTLETDPEVPLPPPKQVARILKRKTIHAIHQWNNKFGDVYKKLSLAYNFLKQCKKIDFESMEAHSEAERRRAEEQRVKAELQEKQRVELAVKELQEMKIEIRNCLLQAENCLSLLLPEPESFNINGLKSPDPHRSTNPWKDYAGRRKSTDHSKIKSSKIDSQGLVIKIEKCDDCGKNLCKSESMDQVANTSESNTGNKSTNLCTCKIKNCNQNVQTESSDNASLKNSTGESVVPLVMSQDDDSDDFQEITDSESENSDDDDCNMNDNVKMEFNEYGLSSPTLDIARQHGLGSQSISLNIEITPDVIHVDETCDNEDIINALKDSLQLAQNEFLPSIQKWLEIFTKAGKQDLIRKSLDIRGAIENMKNKIGKIKFVRTQKTNLSNQISIKSEDTDESDDDFEEVADSEMKEGYEPHIPEDLREEYGLIDQVPKPRTNLHWTVKNSIAEEADEADPTTFKATLNQRKETNKKTNQALPCTSSSNQSTKASTSANQSTEAGTYSNQSTEASTSANQSADSKPNTSEHELKCKAPYVPFSTDLLNWGQEVEAPMMQRIESGHTFWFTKEIDDPVVDKSALASLTSRMISFTGKFEPVKHRCNAPLPSGKLCPRMDRQKCPFHGKIIPRNAVGNPSNPEDRIRIEAEQEKKQEEAVPDWEDPELQREIQAATGIDVSRKNKGRGGKGKGKRKGQKKYPDLTDVGPKPKTSRGRLEAKVFNDRTMKRVAATLDDLEFKRHKDKFGNQFNYANSTPVLRRM